jgi:hypothetical protein
MRVMTLEFAQAQVSLADDAVANQVFKFVLKNIAVSGWRIAKALELETEKVDESLTKLIALGLLECNGHGLDGFCHSTSLGYAVHEAPSRF